MAGDPKRLPVIASWANCCAKVVLIAAFSALCARAPAAPDSNTGAAAPREALDQPQRMTAPDKERPSTGNPLWEVALTALQETRARPIFSPSRRPPSPPVLAAPPPPAPKPPAAKEPDRLKLTLLGTVIGASDKIGVFVDEASKDVIRIKAGESHAGWILRSVQRRSASFEKDRQETTLVIPPPGFAQPGSGVGVVASRTGGADIPGNDRRAANSVEHRARPVALTASAPITPGTHKVRQEIRQDILSIGAQN
jgi:general secretion pathway protein N